MPLDTPNTYLDIYSTPADPPSRRVSRELVPVRRHEVPSVIPGSETIQHSTSPPLGRKTPVGELMGEIDLRNATPRELSDVSLDLYAAGLLNYDEYSMLAFQPELHPDYERTIGALTGEIVTPTTPQDYLDLWDSKVEFQKQHSPDKSDIIQKTIRIATLLRQLYYAPTHYAA